MDDRHYRVCSMFAGAGGIDYAFEQAGCSTVWASENDRDACLTYHLNFPSVPLDRRDIRLVSAESIPDFDILVGGFPCQPFSSVGREEGFQDDRGNLFFEICRVIDAKQPQALLLENVASLETHDGGNTFRVIREELTRRGYLLASRVMDAQDYGFPQRRNRIYIAGFRDENAFQNFQFPEKSALHLRINDIIDRSIKAPDWCYLSPDSDQYQQMDRFIRSDREIYRFSDGRFAARGGILSSRDGISFTLLAGMGNWHDREPILRDRWGIRKLTPMECFRLQGFPEQFSLKGIPVKSAYRQAGNTVCVPVVKQIAEHLVSALDSVSSREAESDTPSHDQPVLVGMVRNRKQLEASLAAGFYHFPVRFLPQNMDSVRWIALYLPSWLTGEKAGIQYVGRVKEYQILSRRDILELPKDSDEKYCKVSVKKWMRPVSSPAVAAKTPVFVLRVGNDEYVSN